MNLAHNGPWVVLGVLAAVAWAFFQDDRVVALGAAAGAGAFVAAIYAVLVLLAWRHRTATITVSETDLVVVHGSRREVLPRADFGKALLGFFGSYPEQTPTVYDALNIAFTRRDGSLFVRLKAAWWPPEGLDEVIAALGTTAALPSPEEERALSPWAARHMALTVLIVIAVLVVVGAGIVLGADALRG